MVAASKPLVALTKIVVFAIEIFFSCAIVLFTPLIEVAQRITSASWVTDVNDWKLRRDHTFVRVPAFWATIAKALPQAPAPIIVKLVSCSILRLRFIVGLKLSEILDNNRSFVYNNAVVNNQEDI